MTGSLHARPFDPSEAGAVSGWFTTVRDSVQWGGPGVVWPLDAEGAARLLAPLEGDRPIRTAWTVMAGEALAGHFQLVHDRRCRTARLTRVALDPAIRGRGYGVALDRLASATAFGEEPALHRLELHAYAHNAAAIACYRRAGFVQEGVLRETVPIAAEAGCPSALWSTVVMAILRPEWQARLS